MPEKTPFKPIAATEAPRPKLRDVQAFAAERGAPQLSVQRAFAPPTAKTTQRTPVARLNLEIPAYLKPQLKKRAFELDVSILFLVLECVVEIRISR